MSTIPRQRSSRQRVAILEDLRSTTSHPTAEEIYERVRKKIPRISLGTVYRNLELLEANGEIQLVSSGSDRRRYDGNAAEHPHIRCLECGRVDDLPEFAGFPALSGEEAMGYKVTGCNLEYVGVCPLCSKASSGL